jgi:hypothetical protein
MIHIQEGAEQHRSWKKEEVGAPGKPATWARSLPPLRVFLLEVALAYRQPLLSYFSGNASQLIGL